MAAAGGDVERVRQSIFALNDDKFLVSQVYQQQEIRIQNLADSPEDMLLAGGKGGGGYFVPLAQGVLEVIEQMRLRGATSMPKLARMLAACDPKTETKQFYRFKNFLYKAVKI